MYIDSVDKSGHSLARYGRELIHACRRYALLKRVVHHGPAQRMFGTVFRCSRPGQQFSLIMSVQGHYIGQSRGTHGDGAGLVENDGLHAVGHLQALCVSDEDAVGCTGSGSHHDSRRCGQAQCTRTGNDEHGDKVDHGWGKTDITQSKPEDKGDDCNGDHHRHKDGGNPVCKGLNRCLGALGLAYQFDDPGDHGFVAHSSGIEYDTPGGVDGTADDLIALHAFHGQAFAGDHGFIDSAASTHDESIHRDSAARPHDKCVPVLYLFRRDLDLAAFTHDNGGCRSEVEKTGDSLGGPALGSCLQQFAEQDKGDDSGGSIKIDIHMSRDPQPLREQHGCSAVYIGGAGAHGNKRIHICGKMTGSFPGACEKPFSRPKEHHTCSYELQFIKGFYK